MSTDTAQWIAISMVAVSAIAANFGLMRIDRKIQNLWTYLSRRTRQ